MKIKPYGSVIVSWDFSESKGGKDRGILLVGEKRPGKGVEVINAFQGEEAWELFKKLKTVKKKGETHDQ